jgi:hypothetical protein
MDAEAAAGCGVTSAFDGSLTGRRDRLFRTPCDGTAIAVPAANSDGLILPEKRVRVCRFINLTG